VDTETRARHPGGRSARVREAVFVAATELVAELGADRVTVGYNRVQLDTPRKSDVPWSVRCTTGRA